MDLTPSHLLDYDCLTVVSLNVLQARQSTDTDGLVTCWSQNGWDRL